VFCFGWNHYLVGKASSGFLDQFSCHDLANTLWAFAEAEVYGFNRFWLDRDPHGA